MGGPANARGESPTPAPAGALGLPLAPCHRVGLCRRGVPLASPPRRGHSRGYRGGSGAPAPTCRGPLSFPAGTAGAGCLLAHPTSRCTPAGSVQEPQESGARGCRQAGTCAPLSAPCCTPIAPAKPPRAGAEGAGCRAGWDGGRRCWLGAVAITVLMCPFPAVVPAGRRADAAGAHARHAAGTAPPRKGGGTGRPCPAPRLGGGLGLQPGSGWRGGGGRGTGRSLPPCQRAQPGVRLGVLGGVGGHLEGR